MTKHSFWPRSLKHSRHNCVFETSPSKALNFVRSIALPKVDASKKKLQLEPWSLAKNGFHWEVSGLQRKQEIFLWHVVQQRQACSLTSPLKPGTRRTQVNGV